MQGKQGKETKELGYFKRIIAEFSSCDSEGLESFSEL